MWICILCSQPGIGTEVILWEKGDSTRNVRENKLLYASPAELGKRESVKKDQFQDSPRECSAGQQICSEFVAKKAHQGFEDRQK